MKKVIIGLIIALLVLGIAMPAGWSEEPMTFGIFVEIKHSEYDSADGEPVIQYLVYERHTRLVYIYTVYKGIPSVTPYLMRDSFGQTTVGVYDINAGVIMPVEFWYTDGELELVG